MNEEFQTNKIVVVLNNDDEQNVMAALVMSAAVAATGDEVLLFIQPGGARIVKKGGLEKYQNLKGQPDPLELFDAIQVLGPNGHHAKVVSNIVIERFTVHVQLHCRTTKRNHV